MKLQAMLKIILSKIGIYCLTALVFLFIGCFQQAQTYNYELEDSDEVYVMDSWTRDHKEDYYKRVGNLLYEFLSREKFTTPSESAFNNNIKLKLKTSVNNKNYQIIPYHIFQKDSINGDAARLFIFPKQRFISFDSELPLLNKTSLAYYNSPDYKNLDHSSDYNIVLNKLLFIPNQAETDKWLKDDQLNDLFTYLVCCFHFDRNEKILRHVIKKIIDNPDKYNSEYLQLLFYKDRIEIDQKFLSKIVKLDPDKKTTFLFQKSTVRRI